MIKLNSGAGFGCRLDNKLSTVCISYNYSGSVLQYSHLLTARHSQDFYSASEMYTVFKALHTTNHLHKRHFKAHYTA